MLVLLDLKVEQVYKVFKDLKELDQQVLKGHKV